VKRLDVIAFGEVLWDFFEESPGRFHRLPGGASTNVAVSLAHLGHRVAVAGGIGDDRFGDELAARLTALGVDCRTLVRLPERTGITFIARGKGGEPRYLSYRRASADVSLSARSVTAAMVAATWVHIGTTTLLTEALAEATRALLRRVAQRGGHASIDLNTRPHLWKSARAARAVLREFLPHCALVKASEVDLAELGMGVPALRKMAPAATVLLTRGPKGAAALGEHGEASRPAKRGRCVDATGAGDAFLSGVLSSLVRKRALPGSPAWRNAALWTEALDRGHSLGARAVSEFGALGFLLKE
jgi:sugar/nucleoside kinase (ribokinase family)